MSQVLYEVRAVHVRTSDFGQMVVGARERRPSGLYGAFGGRDDPTIVVVDAYGMDSDLIAPTTGLVTALGLIIPSNEMVASLVQDVPAENLTTCTENVDELVGQVEMALDWMKSFMRSFKGCQLKVAPYGESTMACELVIQTCANWAER